jgi:hypothetical protein
VLKNISDSCVLYTYTFITKRKDFTDIYYMDNLAKTCVPGRVIFSLAKAPVQVAPLQAYWYELRSTSVKKWTYYHTA